MTERKKKLIFTVSIITIPIIIAINYIIILLLPDSLSDREKVYWFASLSGPLSIMVAIIVLFGLHKYYTRRDR